MASLRVTPGEQALLAAFEDTYPQLKGLSLAARLTIVRGEDPTTCKIG